MAIVKSNCCFMILDDTSACSKYYKTLNAFVCFCIESMTSLVKRALLSVAKADLYRESVVV